MHTAHAEPPDHLYLPEGESIRSDHGRHARGGNEVERGCLRRLVRASYEQRVEGKDPQSLSSIPTQWHVSPVKSQRLPTQPNVRLLSDERGQDKGSGLVTAT